MLASCTWGGDAWCWGSLAPQELIVQAVHGVSQTHPLICREFELGISKVWQDGPYAGGAYAVCNPGQLASLHTISSS